MDFYQVVTDGACSGNPGKGGWAAVLLSEKDVVEISGSIQSTTNNAMEIFSVVEGLRHLKTWLTQEDVMAKGRKRNIEILSDSQYVLQGEEHLEQWAKRGWITQGGQPLKNLQLWQELQAVLQEWAESGDTRIVWKKVKGHSADPLNERADQLAVEESQGKKTSHYKGSRAAYPVLEAQSGPSHGYLSLVSGKVEIHEDWDACKSRVEGVSGAKYKKFMNRLQRDEILKIWGIPKK